MASHTGALGDTPLVYDRVAAGVLPFTSTSSLWEPSLYEDTPQSTVAHSDNAFPPWATASHDGVRHGGYGEDWFDRVHILPTEFALGNILSSQVREVEIYNAFLKGVAKDVTAFANNAGAGVTVSNLPSLTHTVNGQSSLVLTVQVSTIGAPTLSGTLDFTTDDGLRQVSLTGRRVILMPVRPETPVLEIIEHLTDVLISRDDSEQRVAVRDGPRQVISLDFFEEDAEAANLRSLLFDWLPRVWGVPCWWEERAIDADVSVDDFTIQVDTSNMDLRVGGLAVLYTDQFDFEALEVESFDATSVTFVTPAQQEHSPLTASFMPVRLCYADQGPGGGQLLQGQDKVSMEFTTIETVDLSDASAFPTFNSLVLLDEPNVVPGGGQHGQSWQRKTVSIESKAGRLRILEQVDRSRIRMVKGFHISSAQRLWEVRQLFHFLKGRQKAFYLPTFRNDLVLTQSISAGGTGLVIRNIGFSDFVRQREPFAACRIKLRDGTTATRSITGSSNIDEEEESITISSEFSASQIDPEDVSHLALVVKVRNADDRITITHRQPGYATAVMEVLSVKS